MSLSKWFERTFDLSFDVEQYSIIYQRLQQAPGMLNTILQNIPEPKLTYQHDGKWSVKEHLGHLALLEPLWRTRIHDILEKKPELTPTDLDNKKTSEAGFNFYTLADLLQNVADERKETLSLLDSIHVKDQHGTSLHPRMQQPMRIIDIMYFTAEHDDHHIGVIQQMLALQHGSMA
jgi:uncharacterized damage-inducible protein DinB